jgi:hypothetical protein
MQVIVQDLRNVAMLRHAGVPLPRILTSKIRGKGGLIQEAAHQNRGKEPCNEGLGATELYRQSSSHPVMDNNGNTLRSFAVKAEG